MDFDPHTQVPGEQPRPPVEPAPTGSPWPDPDQLTMPGWIPVMPVIRQQEPLPPYREPDPLADTTMPVMVTAASPLSRERLRELETRTRIPLWIPVATAAVLMFCFSFTAVTMASEHSIPDGIATALLCLAAALAFLIATLVAIARRSREERQRIGFADAGQEPAGVIEVYPDRVVRITPRSRTTVRLRDTRTQIWESPDLLAVSDGYAAVAWQAEDLTPVALDHLRKQVYPAIRPHHRKSTGRLRPRAGELAPLPDIRFPEDTLCQFRYHPDRRRETDRRSWLLSLRTAPYLAVAAAIAGATLAGLFRLPLPHGVTVALYALGLFCLLQGLTTGIIRLRLKAELGAAGSIGIAVTQGGVAVDEKDCLRFIPRGWYICYTKKDLLVLQSPAGQLYIPRSALPDPVLVTRLLMLGD